MKKTIFILLAALTLAATAGCSGGDNGGLTTVISSPEYVLYENIFYNDTGDDYVGQEQTKTGTFTVLYDKYSNRTRYYVWGYYDNTKCCDWQWEFVPESTDALPPSGSLVAVTGTFQGDDAALDGYWLADAAVTVKGKYSGPDCDIDMTAMSATLERVQLINMQVFPEDFDGMTVYMYGRVESLSSLQHPYYDGAWSQEFATKDDVPAIGTMVIASGTWKNGVIEAAALSQTNLY